MKLHVSFRFRRDEPIPVGTLMNAGTDTAFEYEPSFLSRGLAPAPFRLPVKPGVSVFDWSGGMETFGMFEDSLPDGWGRKLIDGAFRRQQGRLPTVLERLSTVGYGGMGALIYEPVDVSLAGAEQFDFAALAESAMDFDAGRAEDVLPAVRQAGGSSGGARPKAFVGYNPATGEICPEGDDLPAGFEHWIVKFNTRGDGGESGAREFRYYQMAVAAGVRMESSRLIETTAGRFFATRRFDRTADGGRLHLASAAGLLHADFRVPGEEYALLFRLTDALVRDHASKLELFRRVALNVLGHNRDDHLKNFSFLMDGRGNWSLAPFYDFTRADGPNGWHTLSVAGEGREPGDADLMRLADEVGISAAEARTALERVRDAGFAAGGVRSDFSTPNSNTTKGRTR